MSAHGNRQKHESRNPIQRALISRFHEQVVAMVKRAQPRRVLDVGCGEGYTLRALVEAGVKAELHGVDQNAGAVAEARSRLGDHATLRTMDARELEAREDSFDLVMMLEVLEHLESPEAMLAMLGRLSSRHVLLSVPHEPFFRGLNFMRGKHLRAWGNDPEHLQHWGRREFIDWVSTRFRVLDAPWVPPWTLVLAENIY